jgi:hypothetical protein
MGGLPNAIDLGDRREHLHHRTWIVKALPPRRQFGGTPMHHSDFSQLCVKPGVVIVIDFSN